MLSYPLRNNNIYKRERMSNTSSGRSSLSDHAQSLIKVWKGSARQQTTVAGAIHKSSLTELSPAGCGKRIQSLLLEGG